MIFLLHNALNLKQDRTEFSCSAQTNVYNHVIDSCDSLEKICLSAYQRTTLPVLLTLLIFEAVIVWFVVRKVLFKVADKGFIIEASLRLVEPCTCVHSLSFFSHGRFPQPPSLAILMRFFRLCALGCIPRSVH